MGVLFVGGLLIGIFLGRIFKVLVLVPAGCIGVLLICIRSVELGDSFLIVAGEIVVLMTSMQIGYVFALLTKSAPKEISARALQARLATIRSRQAVISPAHVSPGVRKTWVEAASAALKSVHLR